jgi:hypothetical protein
MDIQDVNRYRGEFFRVLQQTSRSQTAVMAIAPGEEAGPEETDRADQIVYVSRSGRDRCLLSGAALPFARSCQRSDTRESQAMATWTRHLVGCSVQSVAPFVLAQSS